MGFSNLALFAFASTAEFAAARSSFLLWGLLHVFHALLATVGAAVVSDLVIGCSCFATLLHFEFVVIDELVLEVRRVWVHRSQIISIILLLWLCTDRSLLLLFLFGFSLVS